MIEDEMYAYAVELTTRSIQEEDVNLLYLGDLLTDYTIADLPMQLIRLIASLEARIHQLEQQLEQTKT